MAGYASVQSNSHITIDGTIIQKESATIPLYHPAGFDVDQRNNVVFDGSGTFSSQGLLSDAEATFQINRSTGWSPIITIRACKNVRVAGNLNLYKLAMGITANINNAPAYPDFNLIPIPGATCNNIDISGVRARFVNYYSVTLNTCRESALHHNYCYRSGDSGIIVMFSKNCLVYDNFRESPYGTGADIADPLTFNDCQGISIENCNYVTVSNNIVIGLMTNPIDVKNSSTDILVTGNFVKDAQLAGITVRGGDTVYGENTSITVIGNKIKEKI
jgi:hypothetical protein